MDVIYALKHNNPTFQRFEIVRTRLRGMCKVIHYDVDDLINHKESFTYRFWLLVDEYVALFELLKEKHYFDTKKESKLNNFIFNII